MYFWSVRAFHGAAAILVISTCLTGCRPAAQQQAAEDDALREAVAVTPADPTAYAVPDGDAAALVKFMNDVALGEPRGETNEEKTIDVGRQMDARIQAAEKLQKMDDSDSYRAVAARTKLESLRVLRMIGREEAETQFLEYARQLAASPTAELARLGRIGQYYDKLDAMMAGEEPPPDGILAELKQLLRSEALDREMFQIANETAISLGQLGLSSEAAATLELIGETFANSEDEDVADAARAARDQATLTRFAQKYEQTMLGLEGASAELVALAQEIFSAEVVSTPLVMTILNVTQNIEYSGKVDTARQLYELAGPAIANLQQGDTRQQAEDIQSAALKRIALIGQPFEITGQTPGGEPFAWDDYQGKVILVDFWATSCDPCIKELPNIRENYERFRERGFEVVGVNMDEQRERVIDFLAANDVPWTTVVSDDPEALGYDDPNAKRYSVQAIPFLVLVDEQGHVDSLHVRGPQLAARLEQLFPALDETAAETGGDFEISVADTDEPAADSDETDETLDVEQTETLPPDGS